MNYYNELDPYPAQWLRNLIAAGHIALGQVDQRSIADVRADDVMGATQAHFFAGLGGWSHALRLAGWSDDRPVWTASCPCQPFSAAGAGRGASDARHLWPVLAGLIAECRPSVVFGEQVASADGRAWLAAVRADLEVMGYRLGAADLCAAGIGAPHIRQRLFWVAERVDDTASTRRCGRQSLGVGRHSESGGHGADGDWLGDADQSRPQRRLIGRDGVDEWASGSAGLGHWRDVEYLACADGKSRVTQPNVHPLAHGSTARVGRLRAYGNAIVPQVAATFIRAFMEIEG